MQQAREAEVITTKGADKKTTILVPAENCTNLSEIAVNQQIAQCLKPMEIALNDVYSDFRCDHYLDQLA